LSERIKLKYKTKNNVFKVKRDEKKEEIINMNIYITSKYANALYNKKHREQKKIKKIKFKT